MFFSSLSLSVDIKTFFCYFLSHCSAPEQTHAYTTNTYYIGYIYKEKMGPAAAVAPIRV